MLTLNLNTYSTYNMMGQGKLLESLLKYCKDLMVILGYRTSVTSCYKITNRAIRSIK